MTCLFNKEDNCYKSFSVFGSSLGVSVTLGNRTEEEVPPCEIESRRCAAVMIALNPDDITDPRRFGLSRLLSLPSGLPCASLNSAFDSRMLSASSITSFGIFLRLTPPRRAYAPISVRISWLPTFVSSLLMSS